MGLLYVSLKHGFSAVERRECWCSAWYGAGERVRRDRKREERRGEGAFERLRAILAGYRHDPGTINLLYILRNNYGRTLTAISHAIASACFGTAHRTLVDQVSFSDQKSDDSRSDHILRSIESQSVGLLGHSIKLSAICSLHQRKWQPLVIPGYILTLTLKPSL